MSQALGFLFRELGLTSYPPLHFGVEICVFPHHSSIHPSTTSIQLGPLCSVGPL
jgi:hypothetical protein